MPNIYFENMVAKGYVKCETEGEVKSTKNVKMNLL